MRTTLEEIADNRVRLHVEVPREDVKHAVDHAASDLAASAKIPGFRKGKVPMPVLVSRVGRERIYAEAVESHIGGWFWNAAARSRVAGSSVVAVTGGSRGQSASQPGRGEKRLP